MYRLPQPVGTHHGCVYFLVTVVLSKRGCSYMKKTEGMDMAMIGLPCSSDGRATLITRSSGQDAAGTATSLHGKYGCLPGCSANGKRSEPSFIFPATTLVLLLFLLLATETYSMSIFDTGKVCTFSAFSGVILKGGTPVSNATVTRTTSYQKKETDRTRTDERGYFEMPARFERSISSLLPQEFAVGQLVTVTVNDVDYVIWDGVKRIRDENSEARGKPLIVTCDVENELKAIEVDGQPFVTKCIWDVVPDKVDKGF